MLSGKVWSYYHLMTLLQCMAVISGMVSSLFSGMVFSWSMVSLGEGVQMVMVVDWVTLVFMYMVSSVSSMVLVYSLGYMSGEQMKKGFLAILSLFIMSMMWLTMSGSMVSLIIGWDGLGVTSFCLIMYFQNWKSFNSAMMTFMTNRLGDIFIIVTITLYWSGEAWGEVGKWGAVMIIMGSMTKSAQVPFSSWLPLAMAAPTPVSSLVHSSTLVTAGVYVVVRFNSLLGSKGENMLLTISLVTMIVAGLSSLEEYDTKKVIALSTLSHIGIMMFMVGLGAIWASLIHMVMHSSFKSMLFMSAGYLIHDAGGSQDIRDVDIQLHDSFSSVPMFISGLSMMGLPFMSGFYSKEVMIYVVSNCTWAVSIMFFASIMFTASYSVRLLLFSLKNTKFMGYKVWVMKSALMSGGILLSGICSGMITWVIGSKWELLVMSSSLQGCKVGMLPVSILLGVWLGVLKSSGSNWLVLKDAKNMMWVGSALSSSKLSVSWGVEVLGKLDSKGMLEFMLSKLSRTLDCWIKSNWSLTNAKPLFGMKVVLAYVMLWVVFLG